MQLARVETKNLGKVIDFAAPYLAKALARDNGESDPDTLCDQLMAGALDLWLVLDNEQKRVHGAVTTGFVQYPLKWSMEIRTLAIDLPRMEWMPLFGVLEAWAAYHGCVDIEMTGRRGWTKILPALGFSESHVTMCKRVGQ